MTALFPCRPLATGPVSTAPAPVPCKGGWSSDPSHSSNRLPPTPTSTAEDTAAACGPPCRGLLKGLV